MDMLLGLEGAGVVKDEIVCVVTGFDAFGGQEKNPSELAVGRLPDVLNLDTQKRVRLVKGTLPTCCHGGWGELKGLLEKEGAEARLVVMTGVAGTRNAICLERFALNIRDYRIADNSGHQWKDEAIVEGGAEALKTDLPLRAFADAMNKAGYVTDVSNHAGSFICNETYYRALAELKKEGRAVLFVHVPPPEKYGPPGTGQDVGQTGLQRDEEEILQVYADALELLVKESAKYLVAV
jgi:pyroglutamyl-peptidase